MKYLLAAYIFFHGLAHVVGFIINLIMKYNPKHPITSTFLFKIVKVGIPGTILLGLMWFGFAAGFIYAGIAVLQNLPHWDTYTLIIALISMVVCILKLPETKIGVVANMIMILFLILNNYYRMI